MILELVRLDIFKICGVIIESKLTTFPVFSFIKKFKVFYLLNEYNLIHGIYCENFIFISVFCITIKKMYLYNNLFVLIVVFVIPVITLSRYIYFQKICDWLFKKMEPEKKQLSLDSDPDDANKVSI